MTNTKRTVKTEKGDITYQLTRKSVKNMNLRVKKDGCVYISIPYFVSYEQADHFVQKNADFIFSALEQLEKAEIKDPYTTYFLGERLKIAAIPSRSKKGGEILGSSLLLYLPNNFTEENIEAALRLWQNKQAERVFKDALDKAYSRFVAAGLKVPYPSLTVRSMTTRWGSCTMLKRKITLNLSLIEKPFDCIEYVACHELTHFLVQNHSSDFYKVMDKVMPNHKEIKKLLKN